MYIQSPRSFWQNPMHDTPSHEAYSSQCIVDKEKIAAMRIKKRYLPLCSFVIFST